VEEMQFPELSRDIPKTSKELEITRMGELDDQAIETAVEERNCRNVAIKKMFAECGKWIQKPRNGLSITIDEMAKPSELKQFRVMILLYVLLRIPCTGLEK
jgi:hypothetical protein